MILIINGSVGVGKTSISFSLQERFKKSIMLDGDYIGAVHPFQIYNEERTQYLYQTLTHLLKFHKKKIKTTDVPLPCQVLENIFLFKINQNTFL